MKKYPNTITLNNLLVTVETVSTQINGKWYPARPMGYPSFISRLKATWLVFTGKADALVWPAGQ